MSSGLVSFLLVLLRTSACRVPKGSPLIWRLLAPINRRSRSAPAASTSPACLRRPPPGRPGSMWDRKEKSPSRSGGLAKKNKTKIQKTKNPKTIQLSWPQQRPQTRGTDTGAPRAEAVSGLAADPRSGCVLGWRAGHPGRSAWQPGWQGRLSLFICAPAKTPY